MSTAGSFRVLSRKVWQETFENQLNFNFVSELVPLRGEKNFKPRPQNMILVLYGPANDPQIVPQMTPGPDLSPLRNVRNCVDSMKNLEYIYFNNLR